MKKKIINGEICFCNSNDTIVCKLKKSKYSLGGKYLERRFSQFRVLVQQVCGTSPKGQLKSTELYQRFLKALLYKR